MIKILRIERFRSIKSGKMVLGPRNLILGPNGAGKSSIIRAHRLLFFGTCLAPKLSDEVHENSDGFEIEAEFTLRGMDGHALMTHSKGKTHRELYINGQTYLNSDAISYIQSIIDPSWESSYYYDSDDFTSVTPAERRELLRRIYRLDFSSSIERVTAKIDEASANLNRLKTEIEIKQSTLESPIFSFKPLRSLPFDDVEEKKKLLQQCRDKLDALQKDILRLGGELSETQRMIRFRQDIDSKIDSLEKEYNHLEESISRVRESWDTTEKELNEKLKSLDSADDEAKQKALENELDQTTKKMDDVKKNLDQVFADLRYYRSMQDSAEEKRKELALRRKDLEKQVSLLSQNREKILEEIRRLSGVPAKIEELTAFFEQAKHKELQLSEAISVKRMTTEGTCPVCGSDISGDHLQHIRAQLEKDIQQLEIEKDKKLRLESELLELRPSLDKLEKLKEEERILNMQERRSKDDLAVLIQEEGKQADFSTFIENLEIKANSLKEEFKSLDTKKSELSSQIEDIRKKKDSRNQIFIALAKSQGEYEREVSAKKSRLTAVKSLIEDYEKQRSLSLSATDLQRQYSVLQESIENLEKDVSALKEEEQSIQNMISLYEEVQRENQRIRKENEQIKEKRKELRRQVESAQKELAEVKQSSEYLAIIKQIFQRDLPTYILSRVVKDHEKNVNTLLQSVYSKPIKIELKEVKNGLGLNFLVKDRVMDASSASGAERQLLSVANKLALAAASGVRISWLDEVDSNLMLDHARSLFYFLRNLPPDWQIVQISHVEEIKSEALISGVSVFEVENGTIHSIN